MQIATDGRYPSCGSYKFTSGVSTDGITVCCWDCCLYYIRLTGANAIAHRKVNLEKPGIYTNMPITNQHHLSLDSKGPSILMDEKPVRITFTDEFITIGCTTISEKVLEVIHRDFLVWKTSKPKYVYQSA